MGIPDPSKPDLEKLLVVTRTFFLARHHGKPIEVLNGVVHDLRLVIHQMLLGHFMPLTHEEGKEFQAALADRLTNLCMELKHSEEYHRYCVNEVMTCFQWAEQIKLEAPEDPILQKMLAIDIPILRPFDYGIKKVKMHKPPK